MHEMRDERVLITGGSRGLGRAMTETFLARGAAVTVLARGQASLDEVGALGASTVPGDATDAPTMARVVADVAPTLLILNAGAHPCMGTLVEQTWASFNVVWDTDVKAGLHGLQAAIRAPMAPGSRVLVMSSGAGMVDPAPLSGSYPGAKRMLWLLAQSANEEIAARDLGIRVQALVPLQLVGRTALVEHVAGEYARRAGVDDLDDFLTSRYGGQMDEARFGALVAELLTDPAFADVVAVGFRADLGLVSLDG